MISPVKISATFITCLSIVLLNVGVMTSVNAEQKDMATSQQAVPDNMSGKVTEVVDAAGYTYVEVDTGKEKVWAAGPATPLNVGDAVSFSTRMPMVNFHSKSMNRDFPILYFINNFITDSNKAGKPASPAPQVNAQQAAKPVEGISKVEGGNTIAEIHADKEGLGGKTVRVRGKVTKFNANIMGKNWYHISDSSTSDDLTVTTNETVTVGDIVVTEGKLGLNKDFGYGYVYPLILEDAQVTKE